MAGLTAGQLVAVVAAVIFLIIVFWRIAIPVIAAFLLAKALVAVAGMMAARHRHLEVDEHPSVNS